MTIKLKLNPDADQTGNFLGCFEKVEIIQFNYNGEGEHIVRYDDDNFLTELGKGIENILFDSAEVNGYIDEKDRMKSTLNYYILDND